MAAFLRDQRVRGRPLFLFSIVVALALPGCFGGAEAPPDEDVTRLQTYLDAHRFPELQVEVDHMAGVRPTQFALDHLVDQLRQATGRTSVTILGPSEIPDSVARTPAGHQWTTTDLRRLASEALDSAVPGSFAVNRTAVLHVVYVNGEHADDGDILGLATERTAFLFRSPGKLAAAPPQIRMSAHYVERSVLVHEVGHLLGLVNNGLPMVRPHEDPESVHHSSNPESVMYRAVDASDALAAMILEGEAPPSEFDSDDLADIRSFQSKLR